MANLERIRSQLRRDEGEVLHAYKDHLGYWTIGVGRLIDERKGGGITEEESAYLLNNDIVKRLELLEKFLPWFKDLNDARQGALLNMSFQMGIDGLLSFTNSLRLIQEGKWQEAHDNLLLSKWATQTPERAKRVAEQIRDGDWK